MARADPLKAAQRTRAFMLQPFESRVTIASIRRHWGMQMSTSHAIGHLCEAIKKFSLSEDAARALYEIATDPHGMEEHAAASFLASSLDIPMNTAQQVPVGLGAKGLIREVEDGAEKRLFADYGRLGIEPSDKDDLLREREPFDNQTEPHSPRAMTGLAEFFERTDGEIYVGMEVTSHEVFRNLAQRAESGRLTVFLMPRKSDVPGSRQRHYDEVLQDWIRAIRDGPRSLRRNVRIRITARPFPELYTTGVSGDAARLDVYFLDSKTTRRGTILQVKHGTSLYEIVKARYQEALRSSCPLWRIWWGAALWYWTVRAPYPISLVVVGVGLRGLKNPAAIAVSTVALGLFVGWLSGAVKVREWLKPALFKR